MHIELERLIAYRDGALDESELEDIKQKLSECEECSARYAALESLADSFKDYFATHRPEKTPDCPDKKLWSRYLHNELNASEQNRWKEHLQNCDYCFGIAASLKKEQMSEAVTERLHTPEWLHQSTKNSGIPTSRQSLKERWRGFISGIGEAWQPKWAYIAASAAIVIFVCLLGLNYILPGKAPDLKPLPGKFIKLADASYQLLTTSGQIKSDAIPKSSEEWDSWYNALISEDQSGSFMALLTPAMVDSLQILLDPKGIDGMQRLGVELDAQLINPPTWPIGGVLIEQSLVEQIIKGNYTANQHLRLKFLMPDKTKSDSITVLEIGTER